MNFRVLSLIWLLLLALPFAAVAKPVPESQLLSEIRAGARALPEFQAIREEAANRGLRVFVLGGGASSLAEHAKQRILRSGEPGMELRLDWGFDNIFFPEQDVDLVVTRADGKPETAKQVQEFREWVRKEFPYKAEGRPRWDVLGLKTADKGKIALEKNPDFLKQHNDSLSLGMIELTDPPKGRSPIVDFARKPHFLQDAAGDWLTFFFSKDHATTQRFKEGLNPPILAAIRALEKAFRYGKEIDPTGMRQVEQIVREWDPKSVKADSYVNRYLLGRAHRVLLHAQDMNRAMEYLEKSGLKEKLLQIPGGESRARNSLGWWLNKQPLPKNGTGAANASGETAKGLGIERVFHWTSGSAERLISWNYDGTPRLFASRDGARGETAILGDGFYTFANTRDLLRNTKDNTHVAQFLVDPEAKLGTDFTWDRETNTAVWKSSAPLKLVWEDIPVWQRHSYTAKSKAALTKFLVEHWEAEKKGMWAQAADGFWYGLFQKAENGTEEFWRNTVEIAKRKFNVTGYGALQAVKRQMESRDKPTLPEVRAYAAIISEVDPENLSYDLIWPIKVDLENKWVKKAIGLNLPYAQAEKLILSAVSLQGQKTLIDHFSYKLPEMADVVDLFKILTLEEREDLVAAGEELMADANRIHRLAEKFPSRQDWHEYFGEIRGKKNNSSAKASLLRFAKTPGQFLAAATSVYPDIGFASLELADGKWDKFLALKPTVEEATSMLQEFTPGERLGRFLKALAEGAPTPQYLEQVIAGAPKAIKKGQSFIRANLEPATLWNRVADGSFSEESVWKLADQLGLDKAKVTASHQKWKAFMEKPRAPDVKLGESTRPAPEPASHVLNRKELTDFLVDLGTSYYPDVSELRWKFPVRSGKATAEFLLAYSAAMERLSADSRHRLEKLASIHLEHANKIGIEEATKLVKKLAPWEIGLLLKHMDWYRGNRGFLDEIPEKVAFFQAARKAHTTLIDAEIDGFLREREKDLYHALRERDGQRSFKQLLGFASPQTQLELSQKTALYSGDPDRMLLFAEGSENARELFRHEYWSHDMLDKFLEASPRHDQITHAIKLGLGSRMLETSGRCKWYFDQLAAP